MVSLVVWDARPSRATSVVLRLYPVGQLSLPVATRVRMSILAKGAGDPTSKKVKCKDSRNVSAGNQAAKSAAYQVVCCIADVEFDRRAAAHTISLDARP